MGPGSKVGLVLTLTKSMLYHHAFMFLNDSYLFYSYWKMYHSRDLLIAQFYTSSFLFNHLVKFLHPPFLLSVSQTYKEQDFVPKLLPKFPI